MTHKTKIIVGVIFLLVGAGILFVIINDKPAPAPEIEPEPEVIIEEPIATTSVTTIGRSVEGREIRSHVIGSGDTNLLFVGGIHGGYEWNSIVLAYEIIDYFDANPDQIPENISLHIIPNLNPDGLFLATGIEGRFTEADITSYEMHTTGLGRLNANNVDLNRNFDCRWEPTSMWRSQPVSGGTQPFSEPEAATTRDYVEQINPTAAVVWHSRANNVYGSECGEEVTPETLALMSGYARAAGYGEVPVFDAYVVTGAIEDWLASLEVPTVSVELETRVSSEFEKNLLGTKAVLELYKQ
jgi:hypothetical protein